MTANDLFRKHVAKHLAQFAGNLRLLHETVANGDLPDTADAIVCSCFQQLKEHMGISGGSEEDAFLLRFGLVVPGRIRGIRPPVAVLAPERGGFSRQRLEQAAAQVNRLRIALKLGRLLLDGLSRDTLTAFQEISAHVRSAPSSDDAWVEIHARLLDSEARALAARAIGCLDAPDEPEQLGLDTLACLANYRTLGLGDDIADLLRRDVFWPSSLYRDAPDEIAAALIQRIAEAVGLELNHLLLALAWTRGEPARRAFVEWRNAPPPWASGLHVTVENYAHDAGWTLDANGQRRDLISLSCQRIAQCGTPSSTRLSVSCRTETEKCCPACAGPLAWLFDFATLPDHFFSGDRESVPRKILCCLHCASACPAVFSRYYPDGTADWHPATESEETKAFGGHPATVRELAVSPQSPFAAAEPFGVEDATALGGVPMWVQDANYPCCPDCQQIMTFLAQFDNGSMEPCEEGIFYAFFCGACRVAAVNYQQT